MRGRLQFTVPGVPQPQGSKRVVRGMLIESNAKGLLPWRAAVTATAAAMLPAEWDIHGEFGVELQFQFPWPKSAYNRAGVLRESRLWDAKTTKPDLDKLVRAVLDSLTDAGVWRDDAQVVDLAAHKAFAVKPCLFVDVDAG